MPAEGSVLVVDDNREVLTAIRLMLRDDVARVQTATDPTALPALFEGETFDVVLLDMNFTQGSESGEEGFRWLARLRELDPSLHIIMITAYGDVDRAVRAMKEGAADFIVKPWQNEHLRQAVRSGIRLRRSRRQSQGRSAPGSASAASAAALVAESPVMRDVLATLDRVARTAANVLILGEHGTGKELIARRLHARSDRAGGAFVSVDLGVLSEALFESELFGHVRGAFTGADRDRPGPFELADGGTLFLDEIGNIPSGLQSKLLTVLERREVGRVGAVEARPIDIRLVCATNQPLYEMAGSGPGARFRADLLYRINTVELVLPPLRERRDDVLPLARHYLAHFASQYDRPVPRLRPEAAAYLSGYDWPGNVRELRNTMERAVILCDGPELGVEAFRLSGPLGEADDEATLGDNLDLEAIERAAIRKALSKSGGNISRAAAELGLTRRSLYRRIEKYGL